MVLTDFFGFTIFKTYDDNSLQNPLWSMETEIEVYSGLIQ